MNCKKCKKEIKNNGALVRHEQVCVGMNERQIQNLYDRGMSINKIRKDYGNYAFRYIKNVRSRSEAGKLAHQKYPESYNISDDTKIKISKKLILAHKEGRHPGWKHINGDKNKRSYPEKFILDVLNTEGITKKYTVVEKLPVNKYFLDFALIDIKLDIEVDGEQHYRNEEAIEHDKIRNDFLINKGWKIYRINWKEFCKDTKYHIKKLINFIDNINENSNYFYDISEVILSKKPKYGKREDYFKAINKKYEYKQTKKIPLLLNSNIDFSKYGWVKEASVILEIGHGKVNGWMKRFLPEFYEQKCFKRRAPVSPLATNQLKE